MITPARIRNIAFVVSWTALSISLYRCNSMPEYVEINGCKYEKHTEPNGSTWLVHVDSCGCTSIMNEKQFEFEK